MPRTLPQKESGVAEAEPFMLSERDSLRILDLLENPPAAPNRLIKAAKAGFTLPRQFMQRRARPS
jgi:uncharacterized protein (DUF1778 family)